MNKENLVFRKAEKKEIPEIWEILRAAINRRKLDGSKQWQNGYPNPETVYEDLQAGEGFVLVQQKIILVYGAIIKNREKSYEKLQGKWLSSGDFLAVHRVAVASEFLGKGLAFEFFRRVENFAVQHKIPSIKVDTNFDNPGMLKTLEKLGYTYCGEVLQHDSPRKAFEKLITLPS